MTKKKKVRPNRLQEHRIRLGYNQVQVAKFLSIDQTTVSNHELGTRQLIGSVIQDYCELYRISPLDIFHVVNPDGVVPADD